MKTTFEKAREFIEEYIRYAQIDNELFEVLNDQTNRARLRVLLISIYLMQLLQKL